MGSFFASPERKSLDELTSTIDSISNNPFVDGLLQTVAGLIAVLNEHRQIVSVNKAFLDALGVDDAAGVLGLRPGEALHCVHAWKQTAGCGTSRYCSSCGAAIAIVTCLAEDKPEERLCAIQTQQNGAVQDICLSVRAVPVEFDEQKFILLFARDVTSEEVRHYMERIFYHDVNNMVMGLVANTEIMKGENPDSETVHDINRLSWRLKKEFDVHRLLTQEDYDYETRLEPIVLRDLVKDIHRIFRNAPFAQNIHFVLPQVEDGTLILTDYSLLLRVLMNMLTNAFEASSQGDEVRFWYDLADSTITFHVWNDAFIPPNQQLRIFQRHYTSKGGSGRGLGTYSMKLIGETYLKGRITFLSGPGIGTTFSFSCGR
ncbi:PAS domain-containing sensor histidine kinase [bacterium]|nr:PAS domain-containing sensor histidine kinase [bacterium]